MLGSWWIKPSVGSNPASPVLIFWNVAEWFKAVSGVATHGLTLSPGASWVRIPPFQTKFGRTVVYFADRIDDWSFLSYIFPPNCQKFSEMVVVKTRKCATV